MRRFEVESATEVSSLSLQRLAAKVGIVAAIAGAAVALPAVAANAVQPVQPSGTTITYSQPTSNPVTETHQPTGGAPITYNPPTSQPTSNPITETHQPTGGAPITYNPPTSQPTTNPITETHQPTGSTPITYNPPTSQPTSNPTTNPTPVEPSTGTPITAPTTAPADNGSDPVVRATSIVSLAKIPARALKAGRSATIRFSVSQATGIAMPSGTAIIVVNGKVLCRDVTLDASGTGSCTTTRLPVGHDRVVVYYDGDGAYNPATATRTYRVHYR